jgi:hypothetical protein
VKDAKKKLKEIVKKLHDTDPQHLYTVQSLAIDIVKGEHVEKKWYPIIFSFFSFSFSFFLSSFVSHDPD